MNQIITSIFNKHPDNIRNAIKELLDLLPLHSGSNLRTLQKGVLFALEKMHDWSNVIHQADIWQQHQFAKGFLKRMKERLNQDPNQPYQSLNVELNRVTEKYWRIRSPRRQPYSIPEQESTSQIKQQEKESAVQLIQEKQKPVQNQASQAGEKRPPILKRTMTPQLQDQKNSQVSNQTHTKGTINRFQTSGNNVMKLLHNYNKNALLGKIGVNKIPKYTQPLKTSNSSSKIKESQQTPVITKPNLQNSIKKQRSTDDIFPDFSQVQSRKSCKISPQKFIAPPAPKIKIRNDDDQVNHRINQNNPDLSFSNLLETNKKQKLDQEYSKGGIKSFDSFGKSNLKSERSQEKEHFQFEPIDQNQISFERFSSHGQKHSSDTPQFQLAQNSSFGGKNKVKMQQAKLEKNVDPENENDDILTAEEWKMIDLSVKPQHYMRQVWKRNNISAIDSFDAMLKRIRPKYKRTEEE